MVSPSPLPRSFYHRDPLTCARDLIGCELVWNRTRGIIIETEAYTEFGDEACHTFRRPSTRKFIQDHPAGTAYVYLNYGMYWLFNVLVKSPSSNGFVLVRAIEPTSGLPLMEKRRATTLLKQLCSGPGKLGKAFGIQGSDHGTDLCASPSRCLLPASKTVAVQEDCRIGISLAQDKPWRFTLKGSTMVSVPWKNPAAAIKP
jgi:DNA-3-methyladenine glycosylase